MTHDENRAPLPPFAPTNNPAAVVGRVPAQQHSGRPGGADGVVRSVLVSGPDELRDAIADHLRAATALIGGAAGEPDTADEANTATPDDTALRRSGVVRRVRW